MRESGSNMTSHVLHIPREQEELNKPLLLRSWTKRDPRNLLEKKDLGYLGRQLVLPRSGGGLCGG